MRNKGSSEHGDRQSSNRMIDLLSQEFMYGRGQGHWQDKGACVGRDDLDPMSQDKDDQDEMRRVCESCPVHDECAAYADEKEVSSGIWGGIDRDSDQDD